MFVEQLIKPNSEIDDHDIADLIASQIQEIVEQLVEKQTSQENLDATLRRSNRIKRSMIPSDYVVHP